MDDSFQFDWVMHNPSILTRTTEASFFVEYPTITRWTVEIQPFDRRFMNREYKCSLRIDTRFETKEVTVERLEMCVLLNAAETVKEISVFNYTFNEATEFFFAFHLEIADCVELKPNFLNIKTNIKFRREEARIVRDDAEMPLLWGGKPEDTLDLITKLEDCLISEIYPTMKVNKYEVHHCILQKRWTNLFQIHSLDHNSVSLNLELTDVVLLYILRYMYTGLIQTNWPLLANAPNMVEVFQIIFYYNIFHMYSAFMQSRSILMLTSGNYAVSVNKTIRLHTAVVPHGISHSVTVPINPPLRVANPDEHDPHEAVLFLPSEAVPGVPDKDIFLFSVHLRREHQVGYWLSYSLLSQTQTKFVVQVSLQMTNLGIRELVHCGDFTIPANERIESGPVLFMGCSYTFGCATGSAPRQVAWDLDFNIKLCDGSSVFQYLVSPVPDKDSWIPAQDLSSHMCDILRDRFRSDLVVQLRGDADHERVFHQLHKAIFAVRVPKWRNVVQPPIPAPLPLPDTITLPLRNESFYLLASYIYTGKLMEVPAALRQEILDFANNSEFYSLQNMLRQHYWDY